MMNMIIWNARIGGEEWSPFPTCVLYFIILEDDTNEKTHSQWLISVSDKISKVIETKLCF